ncbi:MAG: hypothetical protein IKM21_02220 [Oscillospiraceae bacterium]|nr:hypothetical protein [Oscillospiraceae bacterium]
MDCVTTPEKRGPSIDTSKISTYRGRAIGRAFHNAYMNFVKDPEHEKMIEQRAEEIREQEKKEKAALVAQ